MATKRPAGPEARRTIAATDAAKNFGRLVDRVREERAVYLIERSGAPVAQIGPAPITRCSLRDLADVLRAAGPADEDYLRAVETAVRRANKPSVPRNPWKS